MKKIYTKLFGELDMFAANPTLRSRKQPYSASPCLGAFSLAILGFFLWLFIKNVKQIADLDSSQIKSSKNYEKQFENQTIDNLMFGVSFAASNFDQSVLNKRNISSFSNFFTFEVSVNDQRYALQPCTKDQWSMLGDNYQTLFESYKLSIAYCLPSPVSVISSTAASFLQILFSKCKPSINPNCVDRSIIDNQIELVIDKLQNFPVWFSFLSPVVQIKKKYPLNYEVRYKRTAISPRYDKIATGYIIFQKYKVKSDYNVWPIGETVEELAGFAPNTDYFSFEQAFRDVDNDTLIHLYCFRNENIEVHQRSLTKIDEVLSYVGGLFGLIILAFQLCLGRYNEYKYQLKVGESSFNYDNDGFKIRSKDLNGLTYIKYSIYTWFRLIGIKLNWKYYQQIDETRFQAKYCLDVSKFFRRLEFLQRVIWKQVDPDILRTQSLIEANSIDQIKKKRHFYEYYQEVIKLEQAASVQDVLEGNKQAFTYLSFIFKSAMKNIQSKDSQNKNPQQKADANGKGWDEKVAQPKQSAQQIMDSLMYDLALEQFESVCKAISDSLESQAISEEAKKVKLKDHYLQVEKILTQSFINLKTQQKKKVIMKIPLKILHRLRLSAKQMNKQNSQRKQQGEKPKEEDAGKRGETANNQHKNEVNQIFEGLGLFSSKKQ